MKKQSKKSAAREAALRFSACMLLAAAVILLSLFIGFCRRLPEGGGISVGPFAVTRIGYDMWFLTLGGKGGMFRSSLPAGAEAVLDWIEDGVRLLVPAAVRRLPVSLPGT